VSIQSRFDAPGLNEEHLMEVAVAMCADEPAVQTASSRDGLDVH